MTKLTMLCAITVAFLAGCGSPPPPTSPADEPEALEPEMTEPEMTEPEMTEPEVTEPEEAAPAAPAEPEPGPPSCGGLPKARCQVTQGCAYHDNDGCVAHGE